MSEPIFIDDDDNANWLHPGGAETARKERDQQRSAIQAGAARALTAFRDAEGVAFESWRTPGNLAEECVAWAGIAALMEGAQETLGAEVEPILGRMVEQFRRAVKPLIEGSRESEAKATASLEAVRDLDVPGEDLLARAIERVLSQLGEAQAEKAQAEVERQVEKGGGQERQRTGGARRRLGGEGGVRLGSRGEEKAARPPHASGLTAGQVVRDASGDRFVVERLGEDEGVPFLELRRQGTRRATRWAQGSAEWDVYTQPAAVVTAATEAAEVQRFVTLESYVVSRARQLAQRIKGDLLRDLREVAVDDIVNPLGNLLPSFEAPLAGSSAMRRVAQLAASQVTNLARERGVAAAVEATGAAVAWVQYSAIMDTATCEPCGRWDGAEFSLGSQEYEALKPPLNGPLGACDGGNRCRCIYVYHLDSEARTAEGSEGILGEEEAA